MSYLYEPRTRHPDGLEQAKACRITGCCIFCEEPLPPTTNKRAKYPTNPPFLCGSLECKQAHYRAWRRDRWFRAHPPRGAR